VTSKLLITGIVGSVGAAICCLTPFMVWGLSGLGLAWLLPYVYRDEVLLPLLAVFLFIMGYALWRRKQQQ